MVKFDINAHNFGHNGPSSIKSTFLDSSCQNLSMIYNLFGFAEVRILPMTSFVIRDWDFRSACFVVI